MNRRHFLATSAFAGTWSLLPPFARAAGSNDDLRVAVIGLNGHGKAHLGALRRCKGVRIVALCDVDSAVLDKAAADLGRDEIKVAKYEDYRELCQSKDIDAVTIATPNHTHVLIASTAAANGKHVYIEKPLSHNVWEGRQLALAAEKTGVVIQHGYQRRSEPSWSEAYEWLQTGELGKITLARGFCYKARKSIGTVSGKPNPPDTVNYDLWSGPRQPLPLRRNRFHYDWHWQFPYGNGDLGAQGPHQLDVCRWFAGDPALPPSVLSVGGRFGYSDDGEWPNTQLVWYDYKPVPVLFEVRGLPREGVDYGKGMDNFKGQETGNVIECEGGWLAGGHGPSCNAYDKDGKVVREFRGGRSHMQHFIDAARRGKIDSTHGVETGHLSAALVHIGNISWQTGRPGGSSPYTIPAAEDAYNRMILHLEANQVDLGKSPMIIGRHLTLDPAAERFTGNGADEANPLLKGDYRRGFEIVL